MIVESAAESDGTRIVADLAVEAGRFVPGGEHVHDHLAEHVEVRAEAGHVRAGQWGAHACGGRAAHRRARRVAPVVECRPGRGAGPRSHRAGDALRGGDPRRLGTVRRWAHEGRGGPSPLFGALLAARFRRELRFRRPPDAVQRLLSPPLAALARLRGLERTVDRYLALETHPAAESGLGRPRSR
jgi:hypothetical protein